MPTIVRGQPTSAEIRHRLKAEDRPILVAYSLGKDAMAANLALREEGIKTYLVFMSPCPGANGERTLPFIEHTIQEQEEALGQTIHVYPHPGFLRMLSELVYQPPERCAIIEAAGYQPIDYPDYWAMLKRELGCPQDTWVADGVRAADSIVRRASLTRHGVMKPSNHKVSPIHDWLKAEVMDCIHDHGMELPIDYEWFGRSFDGIDSRFLGPLKEHSREDYEAVLAWFPLADIGLMCDQMRQEPRP
ncbi:MAG: hypothetical protein E6Z28_06005 [Actinomyces urogenitalis]|uniref:hypothetical protein n=1 Tax=Actinomyces urogenitalis TaxID=103621 RepID=UPI002913B6AD|nr:hypothetical protein [Actinomyces urogenitalis]MDU5874569.1 hypothetical protein [Actinomyces urogenitalis]